MMLTSTLTNTQIALCNNSFLVYLILGEYLSCYNTLVCYPIHADETAVLVFNHMQPLLESCICTFMAVHSNETVLRGQRGCI